MPQRRRAGLGQIRQHAAALLTKRSSHRQDPLDEQGSARALGSKTAVPP